MPKKKRRKRRKARRKKSNRKIGMHLVFFLGSVIGVLGFWLVMQVANTNLIASIFNGISRQTVTAPIMQKEVIKPSVRPQAAKVKPRDLTPKTSTAIKSTPKKKENVKSSSPAPAAVKPITQSLKFAPVKKSGPKMVLVIDDIGYHNKLERLLFSTGLPMTLAILPQLQYSTHFSKEGKRRGYEIILHQPMEPEHALSEYDPGIIKTNMSKETVLYQLRRNLATVPNAEGINNHMGSKITQNRLIMRWVLGELKKRNMFFFDSMTSDKSIGWIEAKRIGMTHLKRDVFLDNEDSQSYIEAQLWRLVGMAKSQGVAIGIGHYRKNTLEVIKRLAPRIKRQGVQVVTLKEISN